METEAIQDDEQEPAVAPPPPRTLPWWAVYLLLLLVPGPLVYVLKLIFGTAPAILVLAACALIVVVGNLFRAIQSLAEPDEGDAEMATVVTSAAEQHKHSAIRALKELEFERSVGNIGDDDYAEIVARYRAEAKRAMKLVDEERAEMRARAELLATKEIDAELGPASDVAPNKPVRTEEPLRPKKTATSERVACAECDVDNDADARFCKGCGAELRVASKGGA